MSFKRSHSVVEGNRNSVFSLAATVRSVVGAFQSLGYKGDLEAVSNC